MNANVLLLHGALGTARQLKALQDRIGGSAIDLSGHGGRRVPSEGIRFEQFIADIDAAYAEHGWARADLFGYSMGGYAALLYAARHPDRVRSVITVGTKLVWTDEGLRKELRMLDPDVMVAKVPAFANALATAHGEDRWRDLVKAIAESMSELAARPLLTPEVVARIGCPVLLCVGEEDTTAVPDDTRAFSEGLAPAEVLVLPGIRHSFESIDLERLAAAVLRFWCDVGRS